MIKGHLDGSDWTRAPSPTLRRMLARLADPSLLTAAKGRYDLGDGSFYVINEYDTRPAAELRAESHRRYCDVQVMLAGREQMGWTPRRDDSPASPYDAAADIRFYAAGLALDWQPFVPGDVFVFSPDDIHCPGVVLDHPARIRKVVGKIPWAVLAAEWPAVPHF